MRHGNNPFQRIHMTRVQFIACLVGNSHAGKDMAAETGHRLAAITQQGINLANFSIGMVAHFRVANKLQFGIFQSEFIHNIDGVRQITADTIANHTQFHFITP